MAEQNAPQETENVTDTGDGPEPIPQRDYTKLLVTDDEPAETPEEATPEAQAETVEAEAATPETTTEAEAPVAEATKEPEQPAQAEHRPGTPDKALQKMQQDFSAVSRKLDELTEKVQSGQTLTQKEQAQVEQQKRKLDVIRDTLKAKGDQFDVLEDGIGAALAETLDEHDQTVSQLRQEMEATKAELAEFRKEAEARKAEDNWRQTQAQYPGVNVREVWDKAAADAIEASGFTAEEVAADPKLGKAIRNVASRTFHERASAATKSVAAKTQTGTPTPTPPAPQGKKPTTTRNAPPVTPGGARVAQSTGVTAAQAEPDDTSRYRTNALALVRD